MSQGPASHKSYLSAFREKLRVQQKTLVSGYKNSHSISGRLFHICVSPRLQMVEVRCDFTASYTKVKHQWLHTFVHFRCHGMCYYKGSHMEAWCLTLNESQNSLVHVYGIPGRNELSWENDSGLFALLKISFRRCFAFNVRANYSINFDDDHYLGMISF